MVLILNLGTPVRIGAQSESWPLRITLSCLLLAKLQNRFRFLDIPRDSSLYRNPLCLTLSNTFEIQKNASNSSNGWWSKSTWILCTIDISWYMQESLGWKPNCCGVSNSLFSRYKNTGLYIIHSKFCCKLVIKKQDSHCK